MPACGFQRRWDVAGVRVCAAGLACDAAAAGSTLELV